MAPERSLQEKGPLIPILLCFLGSEIPQLIEMPVVLGKLSWTHHLEILKRSSALEEKVFYLLLAIKEGYTITYLKRQIKTSLYERQKMSSQKISANQHPGAEKIPQIFRDKYIFEFLDLPEQHNENDFQKALIYRKKFAESGPNVLYDDQIYGVRFTPPGCETISLCFYQPRK